MVALPPEPVIEASFGLTVLAEASPAAATLTLFILSTEGQIILAQHDFAALLLLVQSAHPYVTI
jgi:molybdate transport system substrate-binding protein